MGQMNVAYLIAETQDGSNETSVKSVPQKISFNPPFVPVGTVQFLFDPFSCRDSSSDIN